VPFRLVLDLQADPDLLASVHAIGGVRHQFGADLLGSHHRLIAILGCSPSRESADSYEKCSYQGAGQLMSVGHNGVRLCAVRRVPVCWGRVRLLFALVGGVRGCILISIEGVASSVY